MSSDWPLVKTGDIFELINGYAFKSLDFTVDGAAVLKIKNIKAGKLNLDNLAFVDTSFLSKKPDKIVFRDDLLITMSGNRHDGSMETWVGKVCWFGLSTNYLINQRVGILRLKKHINANPRFLAYQLSSVEFQHHFIAVATSSGGQANLSPTQIKSTELFLPPRQVQDAVAKILGELEDKIKVNNQVNQTLEQMAQAIFKSWFVDFEPVKAKITALETGGSEEDALLAAMQAISGKDEAQLTQLQAEHPDQYTELRTTAEFFPSAMQDSELGEIPEGWFWSTIGRDFDVTMGQSPPGDTYNESGEGMAFFQGRRDFGTRFPTNRVYCTNPKRIAHKGDTLLSVRAPVGDINIAAQECCIGRGLAALRHISKCPTYTYYSISNLGNEFLSFDSEGTVFGSINQKNLREIDVISPSKQIINQFSRKLRAIDTLIHINNDETINLNKIRDSLLPRLLTGEILLSESSQLEESIK